MKNLFTGSAHVPERACRETVLARAMRTSRRGLAQLRRTAMLAGALTLVAPLAALAQSNAIPARVTDRVDLSRLTTLTGNTHPLAQAKYDQGAAPPGLPMNRMMLVLKRGADQESALQSLLTEQQINSSPNFHKWLTPDQFGQQFGPADSDVQAVTSWLASFGFQDIKVSRGRVTIEFSGTASQVEAALHTPVHRYVVNGESHWANANDPQIPAALAPVVASFVSLHNFRHHHTIRKSDVKVPFTVKPGEKPQIDFSGGAHGLVPADFNTIYNVSPSMTGAGVTIAIVADSNINVQDVIDFQNMFGLGSPNKPPNVVLNGPDPGDLLGTPEAEAVLDATWAGAVAPAATVDLVVSEDTDASFGADLSEIYIIDNNLADVMTESFSTCEYQFTLPTSSISLATIAGGYSALAEQAAAQGITFLVASGDGGPDTCDDQTTIPATDTTASVNLLAANWYTIAVGGTMFNDTANPNTYWNLPSLQAANGGSAKSYIPEDVWNESCTTVSATCPTIGLWSSGGGQSIAYAKPPWQAGVAGIPSTDARFLPDVSLDAADHDGYVVCLDGSCQGTGCPSGVSACFGIASGTSASVQAFGGIMALVVQKLGGSPAGRVGNANYALYKLAAGETLANCNASNTAAPPAGNCIFNDVTVSNTNIPGETGFSAAPGPGYDEATGLGSVNVTNLVNQWQTMGVSKGSSTVLTLNNGSAVTITHGQSVSADVTVSATPPGGTPTGDVSLIALLPNNGANSGQGADFNTLGASGTPGSVVWMTNFLPGGTGYGVKAHYAGDGTFVGSDSAPVTVTIDPETSLTLMGLINENTSAFCSTVTSVSYGSPYILTVGVVDATHGGTGPPCAPTPASGFPSGTVTLMNNGAPLDGGTFALNSNGYFEDRGIQLVAGTHMIQATYNGDNSYQKSANPTGMTVTVTKASTTATVTPSSASVAANTTFSLSVIVDTQTSANPPTGSTGAAPTGTVTFSATTTTMGTVFNPGRASWPEPNGFLIGEICAALGCVFALLFATRLRRGTVLLGFALVIAIGAGTSCGNSGNSSTTHTTTTTLGTVNLSASTDANGFVSGAATLSNVKLASTGTITATYAGDTNYSASTSPVVTVTIH